MNSQTEAELRELFCIPVDTEEDTLLHAIRCAHAAERVLAKVRANLGVPDGKCVITAARLMAEKKAESERLSAELALARNQLTLAVERSERLSKQLSGCRYDLGEASKQRQRAEKAEAECSEQRARAESGEDRNRDLSEKLIAAHGKTHAESERAKKAESELAKAMDAINLLAKVIGGDPVKVEKVFESPLGGLAVKIADPSPGVIETRGHVFTGSAAGTSVLLEAEKIVNGDRRGAYGTPEENHTRTAEMWTAYLRKHGDGSASWKFSARDVCMFNVLQKISRDRHAPKRDNLVDIAGYAENANQCNDRESLCRDHAENCNCEMCR